MTIFCNVNEIKEERNGYTTYVFEIIEDDEKSLHNFKYLTCTKFPNWDDTPIRVGDRGYLDYRNIREGLDLWYNDVEGNMVPYKYTFTQYIKFIPFTSDNHEYKL